MIKVDELFSRDELTDAIDTGHVRTQTHPVLPLRIFNYSEKAAYEGVWNEVTLQCRGLILDEDWNVVARPFRKFFNYGQPGAPDLALDARVVVTDKLDGSLGILYPHVGGVCSECKGEFACIHGVGWGCSTLGGCSLGFIPQFSISTRGSFTSDQALHATGILRSKYGDWKPWRDDLTYVFEIVYPANRIVVNYGDVDDLMLLDVLETETGHRAVDSAWTYRGPWADTFEYETLAEALAAEPRPNAEGYVIWFPDTDDRLKIKQESYVELHKIVTRLNERTIWEHLCAKRPLSELIEPLPDEFRSWVEAVAERLIESVNTQNMAICLEFQTIMNGLQDGWTRKDFAELAKESPYPWAMFILLDEKNLGEVLLRNAKPEATGPSGLFHTEDTA